MSVLVAMLAGAGPAIAVPSAARAAEPAPAVRATGPAPVRLTARDDAYTSSGRRTTSFGSAGKLVVGKHRRDAKVSYLKFVVPAGVRVSGARLELTTIGAVAGRVTAHRVTGNDWSEKTLTSGNAPATGAALSVGAGTGSGLSFDLGTAVTRPGTYSFALRSSAERTTRFVSAEAGPAGPVLAVTAQTGAPTGTGGDAPTGARGDAPGGCVTGALLVPSCGVLWGGAAGGFTSAPRDRALRDWEKLSGRTATVFHTYHKGDERFPTASEIAMTRDPARPRVLLLNWKVAYGSTWAKVARGDRDARIDAFAARVRASYPEKFFLVLHHEPENDVVARRGSGWEASDYAAMYRHTVRRLRAKGVTNTITVMAYMGNEKWMSQSWWRDLYPGDDVVDWIGLDSYVSAEKGYYHHGDFADLLDRRGRTGPAFYEWATIRHPGKPVMVAEWGVYHRVGRPADKAPGYASVLPELAKRPAIKAIVHFDTKHDDEGDRDISIDSTRGNLAAFRTLAANPLFDVRLGG
ncbi:CBM96 family carbohydrate-binding protein [Mangrovihabitans endophyticus]|nr:DNRLRE domain-containing protein [Mangrovihabitans endophyticus]